MLFKNDSIETLIAKIRIHQTSIRGELGNLGEKAIHILSSCLRHRGGNNLFILISKQRGQGSKRVAHLAHP